MKLTAIAVLSLGVIVLCAGCVPIAQQQKQAAAKQLQQQNAARIQQATEEGAACRQERLDHIFKTYAESAACINDALERGYTEINYPWMDLIYSLDAKRSQLAAEVDAKKITEEDMKVSLSEKLSEITSEELKRSSELVNMAAQQQQASAAQQAARAQTTSALAQSQVAQRQPTLQYQMPPSETMSHSTNCTTNAIGQTVYTNCNQY